MISAFEQEAHKQVLRYHVTQVMFCPRCQGCLDVKKAVSFEIKKDGKLAMTKCTCGTCWDEVKPTMEAKAKELGCELLALDGRTLYGKPAPATEEPAKNQITWRGRLYDVPDDDQLHEWVFDSVCETPDGDCVEPDHRDSWLSLLGLI